MIMKPSDIAKLSYEDFGRPYEIEGYLFISGELTHLVDVKAHDSNKPHFGVLLNPSLLKDLLSKDLPVSAGTMVSCVGLIRMKATLTFTGFSILPARIGYIYNYSFENDYCKYEFHNSDTYKDVTLITPEKATATILSDIKSVSEKFDLMTVMELKKNLMENNEILLAEHIEGKKFEELQAVLDVHNLQYHVEECPIKFGMP